MSKHEKSALLKSSPSKSNLLKSSKLNAGSTPVKAKGRSRPHPAPDSENSIKGQIEIDRARDLVFATEDELYDHFLPQIQALEKEYFTLRSRTDFQEKDFPRYESLLNRTLDAPDEIWEDAVSMFGFKVRAYVSHYAIPGSVTEADGTIPAEHVFYVALAYATEDIPSFIFLHFPSRDSDLVDQFRRGTLLYDRIIKEVENGAVEGDALSEGDELAVGLYKAMLTLRGEKDVPESSFKNYENLREIAIEEPDEIWRSVDLSGNVLVTFIKDFGGDEFDEDYAHASSAEAKLDFAELRYVVVTIEDTPSSSHALLFSFPTKDTNLIDRYRHGENLQAEEVVQEGSH